MIGDKYTAENKRREVLRTLGSGAPDLVPRESFLPEDIAVTTPLTAATLQPGATPLANAPQQAGTLPLEAENFIEATLAEKAHREVVLANIKQSLQRTNINSTKLLEMTRTLSTPELEAIAAQLNSPEVKDQIKGLAALGDTDPNNVKALEDAAKEKAHFMDTLTTLAVVGVAVGEVAPAPVAAASAIPATAAAGAVTPEVKATAAQELAAVLPEVSAAVVMGAPTVDELGITLFGINPGLSRSASSLKSLKVENSVPAPTGGKAKSVAEQALSPISSIVLPAAPA